MDFLEQKKDICKISRLIYQRGLISGGDGNISVRLPEGGKILVTPRGYHKGLLTVGDIVLLAEDGRHLAGPHPTSEADMHIEIYRFRPEVQAIIHTHSPWTTALYLAGKSVNDPPILSEAVQVLGEVKVVPYRLPGTQDLALTAARALKDANLCVLMNHGVVSCGKDLMQAFMLMEALENCSKITVFTHLLGGPSSILSSPEFPSSK